MAAHFETHPSAPAEQVSSREPEPRALGRPGRLRPSIPPWRRDLPRAFTIPALAALTLAVNGCNALQTTARLPVTVVEAVVEPHSRSVPADPATLQTEVLHYAEDFISSTTLAIDEYASGLNTAKARREALRWKLALNSTALSITTGSSPVANLIDFVSMATLMHASIEERAAKSAAPAVFDPWRDAARRLEANAWKIAAEVLGASQQKQLRDAIEQAYQDRGFDDADPKTWHNQPPTFGDVESILASWAEDDARKGQRSAIEGCLAAIQEIFEHPIFQRSEHVAVEEILSSNVRLDLSKLTDEVRYIAAETMLRKIFRVLRLKGPIPVQPVDDRQRFRLFVIIDEAKILSTGGGDTDSPDRILNQLFTEARKFGLGMILASQMSDHFGSEVKANAATWLVLKPMDIKEAKKNAPNVHMEPEALAALKGKGDGYFRDRTSPRARRIQVTPLKPEA